MIRPRLLKVRQNPPNHFRLLLEFSIEGPDYYPWQQDLFLGDPFAVRDGAVAIPAEPGWGVTVNPEWLARAAYQVSRTA